MNKCLVPILFAAAVLVACSGGVDNNPTTTEADMSTQSDISETSADVTETTSTTDMMETNSDLSTTTGADTTETDTTEPADTVEDMADTTCPAPEADCEGTGECGQNLDSDADHCGACGNVCSGATNADPTCAAGSCVFQCNGGFDNCDGDETNGCESELATDLAHCGACGAACETRPNTVTTCTAGACEYACEVGFDDCDGDTSNGCEVDLTTDLANCGACDAACPDEANAVDACVAGACTATCDADFDDCDGDLGTAGGTGCETDLTTLADCGACGNTCATDTSVNALCDQAACDYACKSGYLDQNEVAADFCEVRVSANAPRSTNMTGTAADGLAAFVSGGLDVVAVLDGTQIQRRYPALGSSAGVDNLSLTPPIQLFETENSVTTSRYLMAFSPGDGEFEIPPLGKGERLYFQPDLEYLFDPITTGVVASYVADESVLYAATSPLGTGYGCWDSIGTYPVYECNRTNDYLTDSFTNVASSAVYSDGTNAWAVVLDADSTAYEVVDLSATSSGTPRSTASPLSVLVDGDAVLAFPSSTGDDTFVTLEVDPLPSVISYPADRTSTVRFYQYRTSLGPSNDPGVISLGSFTVTDRVSSGVPDGRIALEYLGNGLVAIGHPAPDLGVPSSNNNRILSVAAVGSSMTFTQIDTSPNSNGFTQLANTPGQLFATAGNDVRVYDISTP